MDNAEKYFNFMRLYNQELKSQGTNWLGPAAMGKVLVTAAAQNQRKEREEHGRKTHTH